MIWIDLALILSEAPGACRYLWGDRGPDFYLLEGALGERAPDWESLDVERPLLMGPKRVLSR